MIFPSLLLSSAVIPAHEMGILERLKAPEDISTHGNLIDWLFNYVTALNLFFFLLVCLGLFGFSYFYSAKRHPRALYTYGTKKKHIIITLIIAASVFISIDMNITRMSNTDYTQVFINWPDEQSEEDIVRVEVMGQQWAWNFRYPGQDGLFNTEDDVLTVNDLRVPVGKKVVFQVISKDVIHSLYFPNTRRKVDAMPGRISRMWYQLKKPGVYDIACAEMCGTFHYRMKAKLTVYSQDDFDRWLHEAQAKALKENELDNKDIFWGWKWTNPKVASSSQQ